jgi:hypothetical protein
MDQVSLRSGVPRLALRVEEAAASLGISDDAYREHVAPFVRIVRRGRLKLVAVEELERFLNENAERLLDDRRAA